MTEDRFTAKIAESNAGPSFTPRMLWQYYLADRIVEDSEGRDLVRIVKPRILYSVNTWLAYNIARMFYGDEHYVWCSPVFDLRSRTGLQAAPPPTSCPNDIYHSLRAEVQRRDLHSAKISENRLGILKSVAIKRASRVISDSEASEITAIVQAAQAADFTPLLYLIPYDPVAHLVREVPVDQRAHPLSEEFVIEALPGELFDVISLERS